jgi:CheY-like chemotaxis protein
MAKILIVDDSPTETYKLTNILEKNDHSVLSAASGEQGVDLAASEEPSAYKQPSAVGKPPNRYLACDPQAAVWGFVHLLTNGSLNPY